MLNQFVQNTSFLCYKFTCTCDTFYVDRTKKRLYDCAEQHRTFSYAKQTYNHINKCPTYVKKLREFELIHFTEKSITVPDPLMRIFIFQILSL